MKQGKQCSTRMKHVPNKIVKMCIGHRVVLFYIQFSFAQPIFAIFSSKSFVQAFVGFLMFHECSSSTMNAKKNPSFFFKQLTNNIPKRPTPNARLCITGQRILFFLFFKLKLPTKHGRALFSLFFSTVSPSSHHVIPLNFHSLERFKWL